MVVKTRNMRLTMRRKENRMDMKQPRTRNTALHTRRNLLLRSRMATTKATTVKPRKTLTSMRRRIHTVVKMGNMHLTMGKKKNHTHMKLPRMRNMVLHMRTNLRQKSRMVSTKPGTA